ncbi:MAG: UDP-glucose 6-dehydrogenase, partial [candidate division GAL15 bacterium]
ERADALVLATEWRECRDLGPGRLAQSMRTPVLVDGRNFLSRAAAREAGLLYQGVGR